MTHLCMTKFSITICIMLFKKYLKIKKVKFRLFLKIILNLSCSKIIFILFSKFRKNSINFISYLFWNLKITLNNIWFIYYFFYLISLNINIFYSRWHFLIFTCNYSNYISKLEFIQTVFFTSWFQVMKNITCISKENIK